MSERDIVVEINKQGRLTLPLKVRERLGIDGPAQVVLELEDHAVRLRPGAVIPRDDAWAYTSEHLEQARRALADVEQGRVVRLSGEDVDALAAR